MNKINLSLITLICLFTLWSKAEEKHKDLVEVHYPKNQMAPYKERRDNFGFVFGVGQAKFLPTQYNSLIDNIEYSSIFGDSVIPINQVELGMKWNHLLGSFTLSGVYGIGQVAGNFLGLDRFMGLKKTGFELTIAFDNIFGEPFVVPYGALSGSKYNIEDRDYLGSIFKTTSMVYGVRGGLLLQLNWLDSDTASAGRIAHGLENTFVDLYMSQNGTMTDDSDPKMLSNMNFGAGLRLEF